MTQTETNECVVMVVSPVSLMLLSEGLLGWSELAEVSVLPFRPRVVFCQPPGQIAVIPLD